ncbi:uncharacterized protein FA14DRAFT_190746 [Meira miltonrushii]|uniref:Uncharacterized protein n=1 Tax=Meira miltonrushii TaxID=1280837 RepID=A0A316VCA6_9BASI|nr:uncharacterized protein FA14DRAFT_190746 [Meira miltonrushii]PWN33611.1 hypothetical protein FA14DRAFT_190746 [Meira miltonrushii]
MVSFSTSPSQSFWTPMQHGVDSNGYLPSSPGVGGEIGDQSTESKASRQRRGSSPGKRALNWFRSRSASPASINHVEDGPSSPSSFVVRKVTKQPGGVSHITDVHGSPADEHVHQPGYPYQQVKSRPISLGVPPGGPGGGTGYGTARSTNDGRPEPERQEQPFERGRSRSKSPNRPPSPGAIHAGAFRGGRIAPGPLSYRQAAEQHEEMLAKKQSNQGKRLSDTPSLRDVSAATPSGPRISPFPTGSGQFSTSPHPTSPLAGSAAAPAVSNVSAQANESPSRFSMPVHIPPGSGLPPVIPLEGIPSPVKIPYSPNRVGASPLGSASPAGSPGYFGGASHEDRNSSQPGSPHFASKWFKGIFGKSPRLEDRDDGIYSNEGSWMRQSMSADGKSPNHAMMQQNPNAWSDGLPLAGSGARDQRDPRRDSVEAEALARKKHSMMMAARIEDEHRNRLISGEHAPQNQQTSMDATNAAPKQWLPHQVIGDAPLSQEPEQWDPPQSKSPPGRKPAPRFTAQDLEAMSQKEREQVATEVDPEDRLSKLEGKLTPAQQIIAETRSRMSTLDDEFAKGQLSQSAKGKQSINTQVQRGFDTNRRSSNGGERPPTLPTKSPHASEVQQSTPEVNNTVTKESKPVQTAPRQPAPRTLSNAGPSGLTAGTGPMPKDMPMSHALQEMMVRFYRFERYAVPLMRSLEGRLIDIERDNQMALNGDGMSANSARDREMDRWVGQMTKLMRHEVGQLQAATHELRGSRELLAAVAKNQGVGTTSSGFLSSQSPAPINTTVVQSGEGKGVSAANEPVKVPSDLSRNLSGDARRGTNASSSSFKSAVPKPENIVAPASNASPNGRKRYTHALGRPMQDGKISPLVSPKKEIDQLIPETPASPSPSDISSASRRTVSIDERLRALMVDKSRSPSLNTQDANSSLKSGMSLHGAANQFGSRDESISDDTSFEKIPMPKRNASVKIGDDYQFVMARGDSKASATSASGQSSEDVMVKTTDDESDDVSVVPDLSTKRSQHLQTPSNFSTQTDTTIKPSIAQQQQQQSVKRQSSLSVNSRAISTPTSPGRMPLSPNLTGNSLRLATPTRQGSTSPISMVPNETNIKTATHASNGLRARAQSYLQNAEQPSNSSSSGGLSSANISASNSSSWNRISNSSSPQPPSSPSKAQPLKSSSSSNVLRDRTLNGSGDIASKVQFPSPTSEEAVSVRPLNFKKSAHSIKSTGQRSDRADSSEEKSAGPLTPGKFDTIKGNTIKSSLSTAANSTVSTPSRPSIKDRVAFFDSAQKV